MWPRWKKVARTSQDISLYATRDNQNRPRFGGFWGLWRSEKEAQGTSYNKLCTNSTLSAFLSHCRTNLYLVYLLEIEGSLLTGSIFGSSDAFCGSRQKTCRCSSSFRWLSLASRSDGPSSWSALSLLTSAGINFVYSKHNSYQNSMYRNKHFQVWTGSQNFEGRFVLRILVDGYVNPIPRSVRSAYTSVGNTSVRIYYLMVSRPQKKRLGTSVLRYYSTKDLPWGR